MCSLEVARPQPKVSPALERQARRHHPRARAPKARAAPTVARVTRRAGRTRAAASTWDSRAGPMPSVARRRASTSVAPSGSAQAQERPVRRKGAPVSWRRIVARSRARVGSVERAVARLLAMRVRRTATAARTAVKTARVPTVGEGALRPRLRAPTTSTVARGPAPTGFATATDLRVVLRGRRASLMTPAAPGSATVVSVRASHSAERPETRASMGASAVRCSATLATVRRCSTAGRRSKTASSTSNAARASARRTFWGRRRASRSAAARHPAPP